MKNHFAIKFLAFFLVSLFFSGCEKDKNPEDTLQDVVFGISHIDPVELKSDEFDIPCPEDENGNMLIPVKADITVLNADGEEMNFNPDVFYLNGQLYSQAIKLKPGTYSVSKFLLRDIDGTIIMATPHKNSQFGPYVNKPVEFTFDVQPFEKIEVPIEVLCFQPGHHEQFGFFWFNIHQIVVKELCFFGDFCMPSIPFTQTETAYGGDTYGGSPPWYYYFDRSIEGTQKIYAGQKETDGTVVINDDNELIINLDIWSLKDGEETVKIQGFASKDDVQWGPPGGFDIKTNTLTVDLSEYVYDYYIIHLDVQKTEYYTPDFTGSLYEYVVNGIQMDMPAIFRIDVYKDGEPVPYSPFSNVELDEDGMPKQIDDQELNDDGFLAGTNQPVCVRYPVYINQSDQNFIFELYIWVPISENEFGFKLFHVFIATDMGPLINEENTEQIITDGVLDFVLGNCNYFPPDLLLEW